MKAQGIWVFAGGLLPYDSATVVRVQDGTTTMTDGPFAETKEQLGGFWVIEVPGPRRRRWAGPRSARRPARRPIEVRPFDGLA